MKTIANTREHIRRFLVEKIAQAKKINEIHDQDNLIENGVIDSLGIMQLVSYIEETFRVKVKDEDIVPDNFESVDAISAYLGRL